MSLAERLEIDEDLRPLWDQLDEDTQAATALVVILHAGRDLKYQAKYRIKWWGEFLPQRVAVAALVSSSLAEFSSELAMRLQGQIGGYSEVGERQRIIWQELIALPVDRQRRILDALEKTASVCTTLLRADLDAKRRKGKENGEEESGTTARAEPDTGPGLFDDASAGSEAGGVGAVQEPAPRPESPA